MSTQKPNNSVRESQEITLAQQAKVLSAMASLYSCKPTDQYLKWLQQDCIDFLKLSISNHPERLIKSESMEAMTGGELS